MVNTIQTKSVKCYYMAKEDLGYVANKIRQLTLTNATRMHAVEVFYWLADTVCGVHSCTFLRLKMESAINLKA